MNHVIFGVAIAAFVLGASSSIMALSAYRWGRGETFKYIGICSLALTGLIAVCGVVEYSRAAGFHPVFPVESIARPFVYLALSSFWYLIARSMYRLMSVRWSEMKRNAHLLIVLAPLALHLISYAFFHRARFSLLAARDFLIKAQALAYVYILFRYRGRLVDPDVKRLWNASFGLMAAFTPILFIEGAFHGIKAVYSSLRLVRPSVFILWALLVAAFFRFTLDFIMKPRARFDKESEPAFLREHGLTEREFDVIRLLLDRLSYREISERLFISVPTVKSHIYRAFLKLDVGSRDELIELEEGLKK